jgi:multiple sugar transport system substrate-binding protein
MVVDRSTRARSRRLVVRLVVALVVALVPLAWAQAAPPSLNIISHAVHQRVSTGAAGDITADYQARTGTTLNWLTFDIPALFERLVREGSLNRSTIDVAFVLNSQLTPAVIALLEPLNGYMADRPIEDMGDIFPGMTTAATFGGELYAVPFRQTPSGLHYNAAYFEERGVTEVPTTLEELVEAAKQLTFTREDGTRVYGLIFTGNHYANMIDLARAYDGDFIDGDYNVVANEPAMVRAVELMKELYDEGVLPPNWPQLTSDDIDVWMQQGRAAMSIATISKTRNYNDATNSLFPGQMMVVNLPSSESIIDEFPVAPAKVEFWSMAILRNSENKDAAWDLIREMSSPEAVLTAAMNGNGPIRSSTYDDPTYQATLPWADVEQRMLAVARIPVPAFDRVVQAGDIFIEGVHSVILGMQDAQSAMDEVTRRVQPLLGN